MRTNNLPIVTPRRGQAVGVDPVVAQERHSRILAHPTFTKMVADAMVAQGEEYEPPAHIEQSIYGGFPNRADSNLMEVFHKAPWDERYDIAQRFSDARYREFAERIIYAEASNGLPPERHAALTGWHRERHLSEDDVPWLTIKKAQDELAKIKDQMVTDKTDESDETDQADEAALVAEMEE